MQLLEFRIQPNFRVTEKLTHVQKRNKETKEHTIIHSYPVTLLRLTPRLPNAQIAAFVEKFL